MSRDLKQQAILRSRAFTIVGLVLALVGGLLLYRSLKDAEMATVRVPDTSPEITPRSERMSFVESLRQDGVITDAEYRRQVTRILDDA